ncbi:hypothetical protein EBA05_13070 [Xanthomonas oryzae pv. oryzae]|nr:hypothetical protein EYR03_13305 [Xanthomonas oryzae pv. oryzae]QBN24730.1 hypothetical protein EBA00_09560 [Xanthomonas oryzae pv. oryzae]QBN39676.1 hypothetical protein EBA04_13245 [Xanthomonas oryzae pv. oryzae]QBN43318.1 hypothetical protein EBA05_13070 [Xanthomonas oryzae pv. oryzae]QBN46977.1 hypothetical protein EBA06_13065 [Xanthomonas oryzae pv. oryzae]
MSPTSASRAFRFLAVLSALLFFALASVWLLAPATVLGNWGTSFDGNSVTGAAGSAARVGVGCRPGQCRHRFGNCFWKWGCRRRFRLSHGQRTSGCGWRRLGGRARLRGRRTPRHQYCVQHTYQSAMQPRLRQARCPLISCPACLSKRTCHQVALSEIRLTMQNASEKSL